MICHEPEFRDFFSEIWAAASSREISKKFGRSASFRRFREVSGKFRVFVTRNRLNLEVAPKSGVELLKWWKVNHRTIPSWAKAARIIFAMTCTSAASERVFSLFESMFGHDQLNTLADQLQGSVMLRYNKASLADHASMHDINVTAMGWG